MNKQTIHSLKVTFYYDKVIKCSDGPRKLLDSCSFECNLPDSKLNEFIANKIENLKLMNCFVFQVAVYEVTCVLRKRIEYKNVGGDLIEIL